MFLDTATALDTVWVKSLLSKPIILNNLSCLLETIPLCHQSDHSKRPSNQPHPDVVAHGGVVSPGLLSFYVNDTITPSLHEEIALQEDNTAVVAAFRSKSVLVSHFDVYFGRLEHWQRDGGLTPTSVRAPLCLLWRLRNARKSPDKSSFPTNTARWATLPSYDGL